MGVNIANDSAGIPMRITECSMLVRITTPLIPTTIWVCATALTPSYLFKKVGAGVLMSILFFGKIIVSATLVASKEAKGSAL
nr:hypothetical protein [Helicobacter rodentium]